MEEEITKALQNLKITMEALERASNARNVFNTEFGYHLEQMSWEMQKSASQLQEMRNLYC